MVESLFEAVPPLKEVLAEWVPALTGEETDSVEGGLFVVSLLSVVGEVVVVGFAVLVAVVAVAEGGLLAAADVTEPEFSVEVLRSVAVVFRSGDLGVAIEEAFGAVEVLLDVAEFLPALSFSIGFVELAFFTLPVLEAPEEIGGRVGGLFNPPGADAVPGGPVRDLSDPVVFVADTRFGAAEVVEAAFFLSTTPFSFPVVCPSLSVSCPFMLAGA